MQEKKQTTRRELEGLTTEIFRQHGVEAPERQKPTGEKKLPRKVLRKEKRAAKKQRKEHYFLGYDSKDVRAAAKVTARKVEEERKEKEALKKPKTASKKTSDNASKKRKRRRMASLREAEANGEVIIKKEANAEPQQQDASKEAENASCSQHDDDPHEQELRYLEEKLGGGDPDTLKKEMEKSGFDADFLSFVDSIAPARTKAVSSTAKVDNNEDITKPEKKKKTKEKKEIVPITEEEDDPFEDELNYLGHNLGLVDGEMDAKFLKQMEAIGFDNDLWQLVDDIVPKKKGKKKRIIKECGENDKENNTSDIDKDKCGSPVKKKRKKEEESKKKKTTNEVDEYDKGKEEEKGAVPIGKYIPPALRKEMEEKVTTEMKLNGLFNKVSEGNLDVSAKHICRLTEDLRREKPSSCHTLFAELLLHAAVSNPTMNVLVTACYAAIVVAASVAVHPSLGAAVAKNLAQRLRRYMDMDTKENKDALIGETKNVIIFSSLLFYFGLLPSSVPFGIFKILFQGPSSEESIDLALTTLRYSGRTLRGRYAKDFKEILIFLMEKTSRHKNKDVGRVKFLLQDLEDLKNNKSMCFSVMDRFDQTKGWLEGTELMRGKKITDITFDLPFDFPAECPDSWDMDPLNTGHHVRLVERKQTASPLWDEARAQGMNTDVRKAAYVALMGAEDDMHAVIRINEVVKHVKQIQDVCAVILHCAIRASVNNPFFSLVMISLCDRPGSWGKKYAHGFKQVVAHHMSEVHKYNTASCLNMADLFSSAVASEAVNLPLAHVRFLKFTTGGSPFSGILGLFMRRLIERLMSLCEDLESIFSPLKQYDDVREGVLVAVENLVVPRMKKSDAKKQKQLDQLRDILNEGKEMMGQDDGEWDHTITM